MAYQFDGAELVEVARLLHESRGNAPFVAKDMAINRVIVSRAYYGAFLKARDKALIQNSGASVHQLVIDYYENKRLTVISNKLMNLRKYRTHADYDTNTKVSIQDVRASLKMAQSVIEELSKP